MNRIWTTWSVGLAALILIAGSGCSPKVTENNSQTKSADANGPLVAAVEKQSTDKTLAESPAGKETGPDLVVGQYLEFLRKGQFTEAERLLSKLSAINFRNAQLSLESPGSVDAQYKISRPKYATNLQTGAIVECEVIDTVDDKHVTSAMSWMLRKDPTGWRITGMLMALEEGVVPQLLSFENPDDINFIKANIFSDENIGAQADASTNSSSAPQKH